MSFELRVEDLPEQDFRVVSPIGSLPPTEARALEAKLVRFLREGDRRIVFDFLECETVSSPVLRVLESMARELVALGGYLLLCNLNGNVSKTIEVAGFTASFTVVEDRNEALARIARLEEVPLGADESLALVMSKKVQELLGQLAAPPFWQS